MNSGQIEDTVWLRLRNNTRWPIIVNMHGVLAKAYGDAALFWDVMCDGREPIISRCHVCSFNRLPAGHYILFTVPRQDLAKGCAIRVKFSYGWEHEPDEPDHFAYFDSYSLPNSARLQRRCRTNRCTGAAVAPFASSLIRRSLD